MRGLVVTSDVMMATEGAFFCIGHDERNELGGAVPSCILKAQRRQEVKHVDKYLLYCAVAEHCKACGPRARHERFIFLT